MSFITYAKALLNRWWVFLISTVIGVIISFLISQYLLTPSYETNATIYVRQAQGTYFLKDYNELYFSGQVCDDALKTINYIISENELIKGMDIYQINDTGFIDLTFKYKNPEIAMKAANALAESMVINAKKLNINSQVQIIEYAKRPVHPVSPDISMITCQSVIFLWILILIYIHFKVLINIKQYDAENVPVSELSSNILSSVAVTGEGDLKMPFNRVGSL